MSVFFSAQELLQIAVGIEKRGATFYSGLLKRTQQPEVRATWDYLHGQEKNHIQVFQSLLDSLEGELSPEVFEEEFNFYLKALIDTTVFTWDKIESGMAEKASTDAEAINIALGFEKDSILFFSEMRPIVRQKDQKTVEWVIEQERSHVRTLSKMKEELGY